MNPREKKQENPEKPKAEEERGESSTEGGATLLNHSIKYNSRVLLVTEPNDKYHQMAEIKNRPPNEIRVSIVRSR